MDQVRKVVWGGLLGLVLAGFAAYPALAKDKRETPTNAPVSAAPSEPVAAGRILAHDAIGLSVRNAQGDSLGKIEDFAILPGSNKIHYAVLSYGGVLGVGDRFIAVPVDALKLSDSAAMSSGNVARTDAKVERFFILNVDKDALKKAPSFDRHSWPAQADNAWLTHASVSGNVDVNADRPMGGGITLDNDSTIRSDVSSRRSDGTQMRLIRLSHLLDAKLVPRAQSAGIDNRRNVPSIGDFKDAVLDLNQGMLTHAILSIDQTDLRDRYVAVPWNMISYDPIRNYAQLNGDVASVAQYAFNKNELGDLKRADYFARLDRITAGGSAGETGFGYVGDDKNVNVDVNKDVKRDVNVDVNKSKPSGNSFGYVGEERVVKPPADQNVNEYNVNRVETITGTVIADRPEYVKMHNNMAFFTIKSPNIATRDIVVLVSPMDYAREHNLVLRTGDRVTVTGSLASAGDHDVMVAGKLERGDQIYLLRDAKGRPVWEQQNLKERPQRGTDSH